MVERPVITHEPGLIHRAVDETLAALKIADLGLYDWAGGLYELHVLEQAQTRPVRRPRGSVIMTPVSKVRLLELATRAAVHRKYDARAQDYRVTNCPGLVADAVLERRHWPELPRLTGIVEAPCIDPEDGREIHGPGYDEKTGLYVATAAKLPPMKAVAGRAAAQRGLQTLLDHLDGFPYVSESDQSAGVAAVLTALQRRLLPAAPLFAFSAPAAGTGKTLHADVVSLIAGGRPAPAVSVGNDEAEFSKRIYSMLLAGDALVVLDNLTRPLGNEDTLNQMLTAEHLRFRLLGSMGDATVSTRTMMMCTGNNLSIIGDAKRRTVLVRLDAGVERPEQRSFSRDILADTLARRDELIRAALTVVQVYIQVRRPAVDAKAYGSFAAWDSLIRRPLIWLGLADPLLASESLREADPDLECMRLLFSTWRSIYADRPVTAAEVVGDCMEFSMQTSAPAHPELKAAVGMATGDKVNSIRLGTWLRRHRDRINEGMQLTQAAPDTHSKVSRWQVKTL